MSNTLMDAFLLEETKTDLKIENLLEGKVVAIESTAIYVDIKPYGTGIIYGREYINARDLIKNLNLGDTIKAKVVELENKEGYVELSLKEARQALVWKEAEEAMRENTMLSLPIKEANKGGLLIEWQGILGFLPASQLSADNYPRVDDGNKDEILKELKKLVGEKLSVMIIGINPKEGKLIFSEKGMNKEEKKNLVSKYEVGNELNTEVTGVVDFGVFVKLEDGLEGLVHISELDWGLVEDPRKLYKVGDKVKAKIIEIKNNKVSLSIKQTKANPWTLVGGKYNKGDKVNGVVIKFNKHGALVSVEEGVAGLVHVSEYGDEKGMKDTLQLGKSYDFTITLFDAKEQKMTLSAVK